jgi:hypothetical protein
MYTNEVMIEVAASDFGESKIPYCCVVFGQRIELWQQLTNQPRPDKAAGRYIGWLEDKNPDALGWGIASMFGYHWWVNPYPVRRATP